MWSLEKQPRDKLIKLLIFFKTLVFFQVILSILERKNVDAFYYRELNQNVLKREREREGQREGKKQKYQTNISNGQCFYVQSRFFPASTMIDIRTLSIVNIPIFVNYY